MARPAEWPGDGQGKTGAETSAAAAHYSPMPSTAIRQFDYDPADRRLDVQFVSGRRYSYFDVPPQVAEGMRAAASKGGYFNRLIRNRYRFIQRR